MSSSGNGSELNSTGTAGVFQQLTPLGTSNGSWLSELKSLGYMPTGKTDWGNIGQTVQIPIASSASSVPSQNTDNAAQSTNIAGQMGSQIGSAMRPMISTSMPQWSRLRQGN